MRVVGIDPGSRNGGIAVIDNDMQPKVYDLPVINGMGVDTQHLYEIILDAEAVHVFIERVGTMPKQGIVSAFNFGAGVGKIHASIEISRTPMTLVAPSTWKSFHKLNSKKGESKADLKQRSRARALQLYPGLSQELRLKKHIDRAEALLIANYGASALASS